MRSSYSGLRDLILPIPVNVDLKTRRAKFHLETLEVAVQTWVNGKPYALQCEDDLKRKAHILHIEMGYTPEIIPQALGDYISCLRAALDQMAWALAHLDSGRKFTVAEEKSIGFLTPNRKVFPKGVSAILDTLYPNNRWNALRDNML